VIAAGTDETSRLSTNTGSNPPPFYLTIAAWAVRDQPDEPFRGLRLMAEDEVVIIVPARHGSQRFPGKPLHPLRGPNGEAKPLLQWTYEVACRVPEADAVLIATDCEDIAASASAFGARVILTPESCRNGTERCAAALSELGARPRLIVNLQGDAPLTPPAVVSELIGRACAAEEMAVHTPAMRCSRADLDRLEADTRKGLVGATTVVCDDRGHALYFSKRLIPYLPRSARADEIPVLLHMGLYAYTAESLEAYVRRGQARLEQLEGLEQLRFLEAGVGIEVVEVCPPAWDIWEVNNPADVPIVEAGLARMLVA